MPNRSLIVRPGPKRLASALYAAGFSDAITLPAVQDKCGALWPHPTELQIMLALAGGESSGSTTAFHANKDGSTDYGTWQINNRAHAAYFAGPVTPTSWLWVDWLDSADAAFEIYVSAGRRFTPWVAYSGGGWLAERYEGKSWMHWAQWGCSQMASAYQALVKAGKTPEAALAQIASIDDDPLVYGS